MSIFKIIKTSFDILKTSKLLGLVSFMFIVAGCSSSSIEEDVAPEIVNAERVVRGTDNSSHWDFNTLDGWEDASQNMFGRINYSIRKGLLHIFTRPYKWDRPKVRTIGKKYRDGMYTWRVFVPEMGVGDQASIGAFLYNDDTHELDFEIGYGSTEVRQELNAEADDVIVYMTSQGNPFSSIPRKIKRNQWYTMAIELTEVGGEKRKKYHATWSIDGEDLVELDLQYGKGFPFYIFCSMENLTFIGDHIPTQNNFGLFDYVDYSQYEIY